MTLIGEFSGTLGVCVSSEMSLIIRLIWVKLQSSVQKIPSLTSVPPGCTLQVNGTECQTPLASNSLLEEVLAGPIISGR